MYTNQETEKIISSKKISDKDCGTGYIRQESFMYVQYNSK